MLLRFLTRKLKLGRSNPVVIDFSDDYIVLPNGDTVKKDDILSLDAATGTIIYKAGDGSIRTAKIELPEDASERAAVEGLLRGLAADVQKDRKEVLYS